MFTSLFPEIPFFAESKTKINSFTTTPIKQFDIVAEKTGKKLFGSDNETYEIWGKNESGLLSSMYFGERSSNFDQFVSIESFINDCKDIAENTGLVFEKFVVSENRTVYGSVLSINENYTDAAGNVFTPFVYVFDSMTGKISRSMYLKFVYENGNEVLYTLETKIVKRSINFEERKETFADYVTYFRSSIKKYIELTNKMLQSSFLSQNVNRAIIEVLNNDPKDTGLKTLRIKAAKKVKFYKQIGNKTLKECAESLTCGDVIFWQQRYTSHKLGKNTNAYLLQKDFNQFAKVSENKYSNVYDLFQGFLNFINNSRVCTETLEKQFSGNGNRTYFTNFFNYFIKETRN